MKLFFPRKDGFPVCTVTARNNTIEIMFRLDLKFSSPQASLLLHVSNHVLILIDFSFRPDVNTEFNESSNKSILRLKLLELFQVYPTNVIQIKYQNEIYYRKSFSVHCFC